jgi:hypothetical protein
VGGRRGCGRAASGRQPAKGSLPKTFNECRNHLEPLIGGIDVDMVIRPFYRNEARIRES